MSDKLVDIRCSCGKLLGKVKGEYQLQCKNKRAHGGKYLIKVGETIELPKKEVFE